MRCTFVVCFRMTYANQSDFLEALVVPTTNTVVFIDRPCGVIGGAILDHSSGGIVLSRAA
jgi:hypothetical protein